MHGEYLLVASVDSSRHAIIVAAQSFPFGKNDTLILYGRDTQYKGTADIADLYSVKQPDSTAGRQTTSMGNPQGFQSYDDLDFLEVGALDILVTLPMRARNTRQLSCWLVDVWHAASTYAQDMLKAYSLTLPERACSISSHADSQTTDVSLANVPILCFRRTPAAKAAHHWVCSVPGWLCARSGPDNMSTARMLSHCVPCLG